MKEVTAQNNRPALADNYLVTRNNQQDWWQKETCPETDLWKISYNIWLADFTSLFLVTLHTNKCFVTDERMEFFTADRITDDYLVVGKDGLLDIPLL